MITQRNDNGTTRGRRLAAFAGIVLALPALAALDDAPAVRAAPALAAPVMWRAVLTPSVSDPTEAATGGTMLGGAATLDGEPPKPETRVTLHVTGGKPGSVHPWHVHKGSCGKDQGILGPADKYAPVKIGADGESHVTQTLPFATPTGGEYMVNLHKSPKEKTVVACGDLAKQ